MLFFVYQNVTFCHLQSQFPWYNKCFFYFTAYNSSLLETKILNGIEHTTPLQYMASISFLFKLAGVLDFYHICGGFAANQKYIITVYECYKKIESCKGNNYEKFRVEVGVTNIQ